MAKSTVIKVSQRGIDVKEAADYQLLFSSDWPTLKVAKHGQYHIPAGVTIDYTIVTHTLGYIPMFMAFVNDGSGRTTSQYGNSQLAITSTTLNAYGNGTNPTVEEYGHYYIFYYDITNEYTAPIINTQTTTKSASGNFGIKVSLPGKNIKSNDYRDYSIHSDCFMPNVHMSGFIPYNLTATPFVVTHDLGYAPMVLVLENLSHLGTVPPYSDAWYIPYSTADFGAFEVDATTATFQPFDVDLAYIILKDPLLA